MTHVVGALVLSGLLTHGYCQRPDRKNQRDDASKDNQRDQQRRLLISIAPLKPPPPPPPPPLRHISAAGVFFVVSFDRKLEVHHAQLVDHRAHRSLPAHAVELAQECGRLHLRYDNAKSGTTCTRATSASAARAASACGASASGTASGGTDACAHCRYRHHHGSGANYGTCSCASVQRRQRRW